MQNCTFLLLFRPIFDKKLKTAPPKEIGCRSREVDVIIRCEKVFECAILAEKLDSISAKTFFLFENHLFLGGKTCELSAFREIPSQFSDKPCETDSKTMKIRVKVVCTFLTISKKPLPPFSKSWLRACLYPSFCRLSTTQQSLKYKGPLVWNQLPLKLRNSCKTLKSFDLKLHPYLTTAAKWLS